ncbi:MAG: triose-phosphate isomerase family protein [Candidatus Nanopelagicaceae bacterium]
MSHHPQKIIGVGLKMYFSAAQTIEWANKVKSQISSLASIEKSSIEFFVLPSTPMISQLVKTFVGSKVRVGSQNHASTEMGAFTGETSAQMLSEIGCEFAEIGHAERRRDFNETDELIAQKVLQALSADLIPIICVGENIQVKPETAAEICIKQIKSALSLSESYLNQRIIIAYEPVWAIGVASPADAGHINIVSAKIKAALSPLGSPNLQILYGGSADRGLFEKIAQNVDGLFLGRSAHDVNNLKRIVEEVESISLELAK